MKIGRAAGNKKDEMRKTQNTIVLLALILAALASCTRESTVPEATLTKVASDSEDTYARSADGLFELLIPAGAVDRPQDIVITTRRDLTPSRTLGLVYEVSPIGLTFAVPAIARIHLPAAIEGAGFTILNGDAVATAAPLSEAVFDSGRRWVSASVALLSQRFYTLGAAAYDPCATAVCGEPCSICAPGDPTCVDPGNPTCSADGMCSVAASVCPPSEGWNDPVGSGLAFVVNTFAIGRQEPANRLWVLGELGNDQIRQGLLGGEQLLLLELTGLNQPYDGNDASLTLRMYNGRDYDDPFFPANNFKVPPNHTECCEFLVWTSSLFRGSALPRTQAQAQVTAGVFQTTEVIDRLPIAMGDAVLQFSDLRIQAQLPMNLQSITGGRIEATWTVNDLVLTENPYCRTVSPRCTVQFADSTMLDLVVATVGATPDVDRDGDGFEQLFDLDGDARIDRCIDGDGSEVPPLDPLDPGSCARDPRIADGYSIVLTFLAVDAFIRGTLPGNTPFTWMFPVFPDGTFFFKVETLDSSPATFLEVFVEDAYAGVFERGGDGDFHVKLTGITVGNEIAYREVRWPGDTDEIQNAAGFVQDGWVANPQGTLPAFAADTFEVRSGTGRAEVLCDVSSSIPPDALIEVDANGALYYGMMGGTGCFVEMPGVGPGMLLISVLYPDGSRTLATAKTIN
jgi:hypothetical protein